MISRDWFSISETENRLSVGRIVTGGTRDVKDSFQDGDNNPGHDKMLYAQGRQWLNQHRTLWKELRCSLLRGRSESARRQVPVAFRTCQGLTSTRDIEEARLQLMLILSHQSADIYADIYNARICLNALCSLYSESMLVEIDIYEFKFTMLIRLSCVNWRRNLQSLVAQTMKRSHGLRLKLGTLLIQKEKASAHFE
ncbi:hypothetical protein C5167_038757, partial [Papaver somniferum]